MIHLVAYTIRNGIIDHDKANARKHVLGTEKTMSYHLIRSFLTRQWNKSKRSASFKRTGISGNFEFFSGPIFVENSEYCSWAVCANRSEKTNLTVMLSGSHFFSLYFFAPSRHYVIIIISHTRRRRRNRGRAFDTAVAPGWRVGTAAP